MKTAAWISLLLALLSSGWCDALAQGREQPADLTELSLEQLMNVEVTSVSKKEQSLFDAPAAIYVVTQEDIRCSGATNIAEALRLVPGVEVARIGANHWAITARGFNDQFANKLLVLIDGRSVYTPFFAGVLWAAQDTFLDDVERIEVIRGPGGTLWGANAVNGVINIITKRAQDTHGGLVTGGGGKEVRGFAAARYGADLGQGLHARLYAKYFNHDEFVDPQGRPTRDEMESFRGGFRLDWRAGTRDDLTVQGDIYGTDADIVTSPSMLSPPYAFQLDDVQEMSGGNVLGRWTHSTAGGASTMVQAYYDRSSMAFALVREDRNTVDLELQHRLHLGERHDVVGGLGYRFIADQIRNSFDMSIEPRRRTFNLVSGFVQDEITLIDKQLHLTLGSKLERNDFTGFEVQPNARLLWRPHARHALWAAVSRAVRVPSRAEADGRINTMVIPGDAATPPTVVSAFGSRRFAAEELLEYELGYRVQPTASVYVDLATFYGEYESLRTIEPGTPFPESSPAPFHLVFPVHAQNKAHGETYGVEVAANWNVTSGWRLSVGYTWFDMRLRTDPGSGDTTLGFDEGSNPHNQVNVRSCLDLPGHLELDATLYYVDNLPSQRVQSYLRPDLRLGWRPVPALELSVAVQDIAEDRHLEFGGSAIGGRTAFVGGGAVEIQRAIFGQFRWRF